MFDDCLFPEKTLPFRMPFDLRQLKAFQTIVTTGSLGRAAITLNITQPALSRTIKRLEEEVGAPLFERHSKGMLVTDVGAALLPRASLLLLESEHAREEIDAMRGLAKGTIRVGAVGSIACLVLPQALEQVLLKWPRLQVQVTEALWDRLAESLTKHEIDLALAVAVPDTEEFVAIKDCRWTDRSHIVAATDHPLRNMQRLSLTEVSVARWTTTPKGTGPYVHMQSMFAASGLGLPNILVETRSVPLMKSLVTRSGFLSWMAEPMYDAEKRAGMFDALRLPGATGERTLTAYKRRTGLLPTPAVKLLDELRVLTARSKPTTASLNEPRKR